MQKKLTNRITPLALLCLLLLTNDSKAFIKMKPDITFDLEFCKEVYPDIKDMMKENTEIAETFISNGPSEAIAMNRLIRGKSFNYIFENFSSMALWILISIVVIAGYTFCCGFCTFYCFKKKKILLNEEQIEKIRNKRKDMMLKKPGAMDSDDDEDELDERNNQHRFEFRIILYIKLGLIFLFGASLYMVDRQFNLFYKSYVQISCKYTYVNQILIKGDERNLEANFMGVEKMEEKLTRLEEYMTNTTFTGFLDNIDILEKRVDNFLVELEKLYQAYKMNTVRDPGSAGTVRPEFYTTWGPSTPYDKSTGIFFNYSMLIHRNYKNITDNLKNLKNSILTPFQVSFRGSNPDESYGLKKVKEMKTYVTELKDLLLAYYNDISESYLTRTYKAYNFGMNKILMLIYGILILSLLGNMMLELLYYKIRHNKILKFSSHVAWVSFSSFALLGCIFLLYVIPAKFGLGEITELIEPVALNESYYKKLDFPDKKLLTHFHSCFYLDGEFLSLNNSNIPLRMSASANNSIETALSLMTNGRLSEILVEFNNLKSTITDFTNFDELLYNPLSENNPNELKLKVNAMTDCMSPTYERFGYNINFEVECQTTTCRSTDHWVWQQAQCPTGTTTWVEGTPKDNAIRYCLFFDGQGWASDPTVHTRYPIDCFEAKSGNPYYTESQYILGNLKDHHTTSKDQMQQLTDSLNNMITGGTAVGISSINNFILDDIKPDMDAMKERVTEFLDFSIDIELNRNCSFLKRYWLGLKGDVENVTSEMEMACYLSLSSIVILILKSLGSFLVGVCFHRTNKPGKKLKMDQILPVKSTPEERKKMKGKGRGKKTKDEGLGKEKDDNFLDNKSESSKKRLANGEEDDMAFGGMNSKAEKKPAERRTNDKTNQRAQDSSINYSKSRRKRQRDSQASRQVGKFESDKRKRKKTKQFSEIKNERGGPSNPGGFKKIDDVDEDFLDSLKKDGLI